MRKLLHMIAVGTVLAGCLGTGFSVVATHIKDEDGERDLNIAENNRISSKDYDTGQYLGGKGIYLNPFVERDRETGKITNLGFNVINQSMDLPEYGGKSALGDIKSIRFTLDNGLDVVLTKANKGIASVQRFNSAGLYSNYRRPLNHPVDSVVPARITLALISLQDFNSLVEASMVSCDIVGSEGTFSYMAQDIESDFLDNLKQFSEAYVR